MRLSSFFIKTTRASAFLFLASSLICVAPIAPVHAGDEQPPQYVPEERLDFDPADLALLKVERVDGKPFLALIKNLHTGRQFEYVKGDFIGPLEVYSIDEMQVELRERLSMRKFMLALPIERVNKKAETMVKDEYELLYDKAVLVYKNGDVKLALELLLKVVEAKPHYEEALFFLAYVYHENKYYKEAYDYYLRVVRENPRNYKCMYNMAEILAANQKNNDAIFMLKKCLSIRPDYEKALELYNTIMDELDYQKNKQKENSQDEKTRRRKMEELKKSVSDYAEAIKKLEADLVDAKRSHKKTTEIEAELTRNRVLYDNNSRILEDYLKK
ncbi:MAG TPA: CDC27 family protein [Candidatus Wallbacteria bacterium]|nr:CDC27 family protein [Candidatus Wallbacteria bacterium]